jgi:uncharacterized protein
MIALLDVNVLVALMDTRHALHERARAWWTAERALGWASCPMTQNGFLRIVTLKAYTNAVSLADAVATLTRATRDPQHTFWPDGVSLLDASVIDHTRLLGSKQITDVYLLALAVKHGGRLVTLDSGISFRAVKGATRGRLVVL